MRKQITPSSHNLLFVACDILSEFSLQPSKFCESLIPDSPFVSFMVKLDFSILFQVEFWNFPDEVQQLEERASQAYTLFLRIEVLVDAFIPSGFVLRK